MNFPLGRLCCKCSPLGFLMLPPSARNKLPEIMTVPAILQCMPSFQCTSWKDTTQRNAHQNYGDFKWKRLSQGWLGNYLPFLDCLFFLKDWHFFQKRSKLGGQPLVGDGANSGGGLASLRCVAQIEREYLGLWSVNWRTWRDKLFFSFFHCLP